MDEYTDVLEIKDEPIDLDFDEPEKEPSQKECCPPLVTRGASSNTSGLGKITRNSVMNSSTPKQSSTAEVKQKEDGPRQFTLDLKNVDKDVLFLLSLSQDLKRVPSEFKIEFKSELMMTVYRLVRKYRREAGDDYRLTV